MIISQLHRALSVSNGQLARIDKLALLPCDPHLY